MEQGCLMYGSSPWCCKESDGTWWLNKQQHLFTHWKFEKQLLLDSARSQDVLLVSQKEARFILPDLIFFISSRTEVVTDGFQKGLWYFTETKTRRSPNDCPLKEQWGKLFWVWSQRQVYTLGKDFLTVSKCKHPREMEQTRTLWKQLLCNICWPKFILLILILQFEGRLKEHLYSELSWEFGTF